jgi:spore coat protein A
MGKRTRWLLAASCLLVLALFVAGVAGASTLVPQTALPGGCVPQFAVPLPVFGPAGPIPRVDATAHKNLTVTLEETAQSVLPTDTTLYNAQYYDPFLGALAACPAPADLDIQQTRVWAYGIADTDTGKVLAPANWPAVTVVAKRGIPAKLTFKNALPAYGDPITINGAGTTGLVQGLVSVDQTVDWADPLGEANLNGCTKFPQDPNNVFGVPVPPLDPYCNTPFTGVPPATVHLHGAESISYVDGGPLSWFTPMAAGSPGVHGETGRLYYTQDPSAGMGTAVYTYDNAQEPGTLWFHDHVMGQTRTNVYSGMAAFYFLKDGPREPGKLPNGPFEIEMAIQDRQFDTTGQIFFPDGSGALCGSGLPGDPCLNGSPPNPLNHPFWIPEFAGDVAIVNGAPWPKLRVEPRRYLFRLLDGSNARMYNLKFGSAPVWVAAADEGYLPAPVKPSNGTIFLAPGERADVIVDFTKLAGQTITVTNDAPVPFPDGLFPVPHTVLDPQGNPVTLPADQPQMASIMQIVVDKPLSSPDGSCKPESTCRRPLPVVRLTDGKGNVAPGVVINKKRQLVLKEFEGPGGPIMVLVNNTQFMNSPGVDMNVFPDGFTELPQQGSVEEWEIINLTMDAHPMHTHLAQFQILNRQPFNNNPVSGYPAVWAAAFGTDTTMAPLYNGCIVGQFCPGYGPPLRYEIPNADGALGGNPAITPYLMGTATPPAPEESGWKDTAKAPPGQVTRWLIRFTPTSVPVKMNQSYAGKNLYAFDPTAGPGYVWHCHIIDHEDQDMMRPYRIVK